MSESKQYEISKRTVVEAYKRVKANKGSAGIDGVDFKIFEKNLNVIRHFVRGGKPRISLN